MRTNRPSIRATRLLAIAAAAAVLLLTLPACQMAASAGEPSTVASSPELGNLIGGIISQLTGSR